MAEPIIPPEYFAEEGFPTADHTGKEQSAQAIGELRGYAAALSRTRAKITAGQLLHVCDLAEQAITAGVSDERIHDAVTKSPTIMGLIRFARDMANSHDCDSSDDHCSTRCIRCKARKLLGCKD